MQTIPYSLKDTGSRCELLENGIAIARVTKQRRVGRFIRPATAKFYTERSKFRFVAYADSLFVCEALEALGAVQS